MVSQNMMTKGKHTKKSGNDAARPKISMTSMMRVPRGFSFTFTEGPSSLVRI